MAIELFDGEVRAQSVPCCHWIFLLRVSLGTVSDEEHESEQDETEVTVSERPESITVWVKGWGYVFSADGSRYLGPVA